MSDGYKEYMTGEGSREAKPGGVIAGASARRIIVDDPFVDGDGDTVEAVDFPDAEGGGVKFDQAKPRFDLIPPEALFGLADLFGMGAKKYADRNWEQGMDYQRLFGAMQRHAWAWESGEDYAPDDHQHHLLSVAWCALSLFTYQARDMDEKFDNRPHRVLEKFPPVFPEDAVDAAREVPSE